MQRKWTITVEYKLPVFCSNRDDRMLRIATIFSNVNCPFIELRIQIAICSLPRSRNIVNSSFEFILKMLYKSFAFVLKDCTMGVFKLQNWYFIYYYVWSAAAAAVVTSTISFLCPANFLWQGNSWIYGGRVKGSLSSKTESGQTLYSSSSFCFRSCMRPVY